jgi:ribokinase
VLCQLEIRVEAVTEAAERADRFFLNAAPARPIPAALVRSAELVVVNRYELETLPETPRLTALTLGDEGAVLLERGEEVARAAAPQVEAVDGTAAGDAFTACLVVSLLEERDREEALRRACAAGALAASRPGAQPSLPTAGEVDALLDLS